MLVLSRKKDESIIINGNIVVTIVEVRGDKVRLGFIADRSVEIHRQEVYEAIQNEKKSQLQKLGGDEVRETDSPAGS